MHPSALIDTCMSLRIAQLQEVRTAPAAHGAGGGQAGLLPEHLVADSARGEEKLFIGSLVPVRQTEAFASEADLSDTLITLEVHAKVDLGMPGDWQSVVPVDFH